MSHNRYAARSDQARAAIVEGLRKCGVHTWDVRRPADLLCWHSSWGPGRFRLLEIKTPRGKRNPKPRMDQRQISQNEFIRLTGTPIVTDLSTALAALGLAGPSASCTSKPHSAATSSVDAP